MSTATGTFAEALLSAIDAQLEQQGRLAAICEAQTSALAARDVPSVDALTRAVESEMLAARDIEAQRARAALDLAGDLGLEGESPTLDELADGAGGGVASALRRRGLALQVAVERLRRASAVNQVLIKGELSTIDRIVRALHAERRDTYGGEGAMETQANNVLDARA